MKKLLQLIIVLIPIGLFVWLLIVDIAPGGERVAIYEMGDKSPMVNRLLPSERVGEIQTLQNGDRYVAIQDDPVYFSINLPQTDFQEVEVEVAFSNSGQPILEIGALADIFSASYDLRPLQSLEIEAADWQKFSRPNVTLLDRTGEVSSLDQFFDELPKRDKIATYHYELSEPYRLPDYQPATSQQTIEVSLRGHHQFFTYLKDEVLDLFIEFDDVNRQIGPDEFAVRVWNERNEVVYEKLVEDDGNTTENQYMTTRTVKIQKSELPEGVYRVELSGTSDAIWRKITTSQRYVTFIDRIYLADQIGKLAEPVAVGFYTNAKNLTLETFHAESTQTLELGNEQVRVAQTHEKYTHQVEDSGLVRGYSPVGDIKISGQGKYAFSTDSFFDPDPARISAETDLDSLAVDYILTGYQTPEEQGEWLVNSSTFSLAGLAQEEGAVRLLISAPGIKNREAEVRIHEIVLRYKKPPLTFGGFIKELWQRLPLGL